MAEAIPENQPDFAGDLRKPISVLVLATRWTFDTYGLSTVNKSLVNNLRLVDPEAKTIKVTCAVLEEDGEISKVERKAAEKCGVEIKGAKQPRGPKKKPNIEWLDQSPGTYYRHLVKDQKYDFIIGHVPYLANGGFNLRDLCEERGASPKVILLVHGLPKNTEGQVDDELLLDWLSEAEVVFSVGKAVESEIIPYINGLEEDKKPVHKMYIPAYPLEFFNIRREVKENKVQGTQNITMMTGERKDLDVSGLDFPLAVESTIAASEHIKDFDGVRTNLIVLAGRKEDTEQWKGNFADILQQNKLDNKSLSFQCNVPDDTAKVKIEMRRSNLFLFSSKPDSPLFGTEALTAVAAGVPILVSRYCGMSYVLHSLIQKDSIVIPTESQSDGEAWKEGILQKLLRPDDSQRQANSLREQLLLDTSIAKSHLDFIKTVTESACIQLEMELDTDSVVSHEHIDTAIKFDVELGTGPVDVRKYVVAFFHKLLVQQETLGQGLLESHLKPQIAKMWQEVLSFLENTNRKLVNIQSESFIFTLFCPRRSSLHQVQDESWRKTLEDKLDKLLKLLGVEAQTRVRPPDLLELTEPERLPRLHKLKIADSEKHSIGYETMTTGSEIGSEVLMGIQKVRDWFSRQQDIESSELEQEEQAINLLDTWSLDHVEPEQPNTVYAFNRFAVSESGVFGISCMEKPSLSVIYPNTDKPPLVLSGDKTCISATFVKLANREFLAANLVDDGNLYLWDTEKGTSKKVFDLNAHVNEPTNWMNIFVIDDTTVGYGEAVASADGSRRVFILNTDTEDEWNLSGTIRVVTGDNIWDMSYMMTQECTPCLLVCCPNDHIVQAVEMIGGRIKWKTGKQQMGEMCKPWSICTDKDNNVYVADFCQHRLHILSAEDGTAVKSVNLRQYGITDPFTVRCHGEYLYVEDKIPGKKYAISKFERKLQE